MFSDYLGLPVLSGSFLELPVFFTCVAQWGCLFFPLTCTSSLYMMLTNPLSPLNIENIYFVTFNLVAFL